MKAFAYARPGSIAEALELAGDGDDTQTAYLAGGTNLVDHLRLGIARPDTLIDLSRLDFGGVEETADGGLRIGANVRNADLAADPALRRRFPFVSEALLAGASGQLRSMASTGGNLLQRTRCVYFQDRSTPCNKREPGSGCSALDGYGTYNALIGASEHCVAVHPSDLCVPLAALDAIVHVTGPGGERAIPFDQFHRLPGDAPERDTTLEASEIITAVEILALPWASRSRYRKVRDRASYAFALVSVAAAVDVADGVVTDVRLALGGVSHKPHRARAAEDALRGQPATPAAFEAAIDAELEAARPGKDNAFKVGQLRRTTVAVLTELTQTEGDRP
ncbi:FAD binding domain-containing protein [Propioniciclava soli]|uniref:FAD binding domain-containing protein n=1 Tax=Propioniciclava soli TaxID=2775081 RepID=UPI001E62D160|nr:xanthine dehydrogenase family protein subunit M [Propioniciclava soli]